MLVGKLPLVLWKEGDDGGGGGNGDPPDLGWRANLPEDLQNNETLATFKDESEMINMPVTVAKSYVHARSLIGADTIKIPKTDEEWSDVYNKLGRPENPELYVLQTPENVPEQLKETVGKDTEWFRAAAHELGLSDNQATHLFQKFVGHMSDKFGQQITLADQKKVDTEIQLRTEYGSTYDGKNVLGDRALESLGGGAIQKMWNELKLDAHPEFMRLKFKIGEVLAEDLGLDKTTGKTLVSPDSLQDQIKTLMESKPYFDATHPEHQATVTKVQSLMKQLHGVKPIPSTISTGSLPA